MRLSSCLLPFTLGALALCGVATAATPAQVQPREVGLAHSLEPRSMGLLPEIHFDVIQITAVRRVNAILNRIEEGAKILEQTLDFFLTTGSGNSMSAAFQALSVFHNDLSTIATLTTYTTSVMATENDLDSITNSMDSIVATVTRIVEKLIGVQPMFKEAGADEKIGELLISIMMAVDAASYGLMDWFPQDQNMFIVAFSAKFICEVKRATLSYYNDYQYSDFCEIELKLWPSSGKLRDCKGGAVYPFAFRPDSCNSCTRFPFYQAGGWKQDKGKWKWNTNTGCGFDNCNNDYLCRPATPEFNLCWPKFTVGFAKPQRDQCLTCVFWNDIPTISSFPTPQTPFAFPVVKRPVANSSSKSIGGINGIGKFKTAGKAPGTSTTAEGFANGGKVDAQSHATSKGTTDIFGGTHEHEKSDSSGTSKGTGAFKSGSNTKATNTFAQGASLFNGNVKAGSNAEAQQNDFFGFGSNSEKTKSQGTSLGLGAFKTEGHTIDTDTKVQGASGINGGVKTKAEAQKSGNKEKSTSGGVAVNGAGFKTAAQTDNTNTNAEGWATQGSTSFAKSNANSNGVSRRSILKRASKMVRHMRRDIISSSGGSQGNGQYNSGANGANGNTWVSGGSTGSGKSWAKSVSSGGGGGGGGDNNCATCNGGGGMGGGGPSGFGKGDDYGSGYGDGYGDLGGSVDKGLGGGGGGGLGGFGLGGGGGLGGGFGKPVSLGGGYGGGSGGGLGGGLGGSGDTYLPNGDYGGDHTEDGPEDDEVEKFDPTQQDDQFNPIQPDNPYDTTSENPYDDEPDQQCDTCKGGYKPPFFCDCKGHDGSNTCKAKTTVGGQAGGPGSGGVFGSGGDSSFSATGQAGCCPKYMKKSACKTVKAHVEGKTSGNAFASGSATSSTTDDDMQKFGAVCMQSCPGSSPFDDLLNDGSGGDSGYGKGSGYDQYGKGSGGGSGSGYGGGYKGSNYKKLPSYSSLLQNKDKISSDGDDIYHDDN